LKKSRSWLRGPPTAGGAMHGTIGTMDNPVLLWSGVPQEIGRGPRQTWLRAVTSDLFPLNIGPNAAWRRAQNWDRWRWLASDDDDDDDDGGL